MPSFCDDKYRNRERFNLSSATLFHQLTLLPDTIGRLCRRACDWLRQKADDEDEEEQQAREAVDALCLAV